jgi:DNA-binding PadR family transcriptional regulator
MASPRHTHRAHEGLDRPYGRSRRFFRSGELHLVLLALLAERPRHGYELMAELDARFGPAYRPSPGSIYPALTALEEETLIEARDDGDRRVYSLTPVGETALEDRRATLASVEARTGARLAGTSLEAALARLNARVRGVAGRVDADKAERVLDEAGTRIERLTVQERDQGSSHD